MNATASHQDAGPAAAAKGVASSKGASSPRSRPEEIDNAIADLVQHKEAWVKVSVADRQAILGELSKDFLAVAERWAEAVRAAEGIPAGTPTAGEEWLVGPYLVLRNLGLLKQSLADIQNQGKPRIPGPIRRRENGQTTAQVFPANKWDRILYDGITAEVRMQQGISPEQLPHTQALAYRADRNQKGRVGLVLGAGNVSSIGPMDALYKLFVENAVVLYKMHPLNAYLGPLLEEGFQALVDWGVLRVVYGDAEEGAYCCQHPEVDEIHITGSDRTVEAIVFGTGPEGAQRKAQRRPRLLKPISSELGNVSPVIVVPGPWSPSDLAYQGENLAAMLVNNAGFNCNATRVVVQHANWSQRGPLLDAMRQSLDKVPSRPAYYPGAQDRFRNFLAQHPDAERYGETAPGELPWTLIPDLDPEAAEEICFSTESFCGLTGETAIEAETVTQFIDEAVRFANERLWGTLNATILVHPRSLRDPEVAEALERGVDDLRYGTVSINNWAALGFGLVATPWGAYPGSDLYDIQSGSGIVHNTLMFSEVEKTVIRSPFRMRPKPIWFPSHRTALVMGQKLTAFEAAPSPWKLPGIFWSALRG